MSDIYASTLAAVLEWLAKEIQYVHTIHADLLGFNLMDQFTPNTKFILLHKGTLQEIPVFNPARVKATKSRRTMVNIATLPDADIIVPVCKTYLDATENLAVKKARMLHFMGMLQAAPHKYTWAIQQLPQAFRHIGLPSDSILPYGEPDPWQEEGIALIFAQPTLDLLGIY
jgi:hypothetical protein